MKSPSSAGATPALASSPATSTSTSTRVSGVPCCSSRRSAESDATEWISSTCGTMSLTLRLWSWPMKCQRKTPGYASALATRSCARFSPSSVTPASASTPSSSSGTYLTAASSSASPISERMRSAFSRTRAASRPVISSRHTTPAWRPVTPPSARWEKNRSGRQIVHSPTSWTSATPASASFVAGDGGQVEVALAHARVRARARSARAPPRRPRSSSRARTGRSRR